MWYDDMTSIKTKFTTYERDAESTNDYAMARYYINRLGRFASPDPLSGSISNPQSLNRYTYVQNDPSNAVDPSGKRGCFIPLNWKDLSGGDCGGGGGSLSEDYFLSSLTFGNDIFDALGGVPGTYVHLDIRGNMSLGFSLDLYSETQNFLDQNSNLNLRGNPALQVVVQDLGTQQITSGLVPEYVALLQAQSQVLAAMPKRFADDMAVAQDNLVQAGMDPGIASLQALALEVTQMQTWFSSEPDAANWLNMWQGQNQNLAGWMNRWGSIFPYTH
jgi:RHS repeat-associated protein